MNERIKNMAQNIQALNDEGIRRNKYYGLIAHSLRSTVDQPVQIRRAKAFEYLLDNAEQVVLPYELLAGSILGVFPVEKQQAGYEELYSKAVKLLESYLAEKNSPVKKEDGHRPAIKTFEAEFGTKKSRWALMSRVHHDASITYQQLQSLIDDMQQHFSGIKELEKYEIGRELERHFKLDYDKDEKRLFDELPWYPANHLALDYPKVIANGLESIRKYINEKLAGARTCEQEEFYISVQITINAVTRFISRYAGKLLEESGRTDTPPERSLELKEMGAICKKVSEHKPDTFREGLQLLWMLHVIASIAGGSALSFAGFDRYMSELYQRDLANGTMTREEAKELLCCMWLKVNEPKMRTVQSLTLGGITPDGRDGTNDLTRLCLEVVREVRKPYPNIGVRINDISPDWLYDEVVQTIRAGIGHPMILNDRVWIPNLEKLGYPDSAANDYYNMGCVEIMIPGKQPNWGVTEPIAFPMLLEDVFTKWKRGEVTRDTFDDFMDAYLTVLKNAVHKDRDEALAKKKSMLGCCYDPYASILTGDCLERGKDLFQGGSLYPTHWSVYAYGLGTTADSLSAVKKLVYDEKRFTIEELSAALDADFDGYAAIHSILDRLTPAFGNDNDFVDELAARVFQAFTDEVFLMNEGLKDDRFVSTLFSYFFHVYHGEITGATPNGRRRGETFSDGMGPSQGKDVEGPTKMINSVLKLDHSNVTGGYALNLKINPDFVKDARSRKALAALIKSYLLSGGPQLQINLVDVEALKDAQLHPEKHLDLIVRIGGYCECFVNLDRSLQNEIIGRTTHGLG
mgnify:CR=1 FL=1